MILISVMDRDNHKWPGFSVVSEEKFAKFPPKLKAIFDQAIVESEKKDNPRIYFAYGGDDHEGDEKRKDFFFKHVDKMDDLNELLRKGEKVEIKHFMVFVE